jgi:hypothetical protein
VTTDPNAAPSAWTRLWLWLAAVCATGIVGSFLDPGPENTLYKIGHALNGDGPSLLAVSLGAIATSPLTLWEGFIKCLGNSLGVSGPSVFLLIFATGALILVHFVFFLRVRERGSWYLLCVAFVPIVLLSLIGCTMNSFPNLIPGWT